MGSVVTGVTDTLGLTDSGAPGEASAQSDYYAQESLSLTKAELDFQKEQYAEWKDIYGDLQEDLGTYFKNLTGDEIAAREVTEIQRAGQDAQTNTDKVLAQKGLSSSGVQAQSIMNNTYGTEMAKADSRANADDKATSQKMNFLGLGLGQGSEMLANSANVANSGASSLMGMSNTALNGSYSLQQSNQSGAASFLNQGTDIAGSLIMG